MKLFILGYMGAGKSHTGRLLAQKLDIPFLDMDEQIEIQEGRSITNIFESIGEEGFRKLERDFLDSLNSTQSAVIATGGGTPCFFDNMDRMNAQGKTIYLRTHPKLLVQRLAKEQSSRPVIAHLTPQNLPLFVQEQILLRSKFYEQAELVYFQEEEGQEIVSELLDRLAIVG